ncbi:MAG: TIM barrel protein, partial [Raoultibacter sp.]
MKYSLCIEPILPQMDILERIDVAAKIGYDAVEFWNPSKVNVDELVKRATHRGMTVSVCCAFNHRKDHLASEQAVPSITRSIEQLSVLGIKRIILMSGDVHSRVDNQLTIMVKNLERLRGTAEKHDVCLLLEPLNSYVDHR